MSLVAAVLGYLGLGWYLDRPGSGFSGARVADHVFYPLQLFVLDPTPLAEPPYNVPLSIALYLAPLTTVLTLLHAASATFRTALASWALRHERGHVVVVGADPVALLLAQWFAGKGRGTTVLVGSAVEREVARRHRIRVVPGQSADEATLRAAGLPGASVVFALAEQGAANAAVALLVRSLGNGAIPVYARVDDPGLVAAMRAAAGGRGRHRERTATTHSDLLPWEAGLPEEAKEKDRLFVRELPDLLDAEDLAIVRLPRRGRADVERS